MKNSGLKIVTTVLILLFITTLPAVAEENSYKIGPGDSIVISVWKDETMTREIIVPPDGIISYPLIGTTNANGLSVPKLQAIITRKIKEYVKDAAVNVMLISANSMKAYVVGKVNKPGQYPINMETTVMQIIAMAQDLSPFASPGNLLVLRKQKDKFIKIPFDYNDVKKGKRMEQNIVLERGDIVVVP